MSGEMKALCLDIDDTVYAVLPCHEEGMKRAALAGSRFVPAWKSVSVFEKDYVSARDEIHKGIPGEAASHCRLLYVKRMLEMRDHPALLEAVIPCHDAYWEGYFAKMELANGCRQVLEEVIAREIPICFVSNFTTERQILKLKHLGIADLGWLVTSEEAGADKPSPAPFKLALKKLGLPATEVVYVGDDWKADIQSSLSLGMTPVWYSPSGKEAPAQDPRILICRDWQSIHESLLRRRAA